MTTTSLILPWNATHDGPAQHVATYRHAYIAETHTLCRRHAKHPPESIGSLGECVVGEHNGRCEACDDEQRERGYARNRRVLAEGAKAAQHDPEAARLLAAVERAEGAAKHAAIGALDRRLVAIAAIKP